MWELIQVEQQQISLVGLVFVPEICASLLTFYLAATRWASQQNKKHSSHFHGIKIQCFRSHTQTLSTKVSEFDAGNRTTTKDEEKELQTRRPLVDELWRLFCHMRRDDVYKEAQESSKWFCGNFKCNFNLFQNLDLMQRRNFDRIYTKRVFNLQLNMMLWLQTGLNVRSLSRGLTLCWHNGQDLRLLNHFSIHFEWNLCPQVRVVAW